jgi:hypothetical protein
MAFRDPAFRRKQGVVVALAIAAALVVHARDWFAGMLPTADDLATRLAFAVRWLGRVPGLSGGEGVRDGVDRIADGCGICLAADWPTAERPGVVMAARGG